MCLQGIGATLLDRRSPSLLPVYADYTRRRHDSQRFDGQAGPEGRVVIQVRMARALRSSGLKVPLNAQISRLDSGTLGEV